MKIDIAVSKTIKLYSGLGWKSLFAKIRFWDAPYIEVANLIPKTGKIIDLGCGDGLFGNFLAVISPTREIFGVEKNFSRIKDADRGLSNTQFFCGDVIKKAIPEADVIVLFHLLHHLNSFKDQEKLLEDCSHKLRKKGKIIIVEIEPKLSLKFLITWFTDHYLVPWLFEKKFYSPIFFRKSSEWKQLMENIGFDCKVYFEEKGKPFTHVILDCKR